MSLLDPAYSLLSVIAAFILGFLVGRITGVATDPRRAEERKRRERAAAITAADNSMRLSEKARREIEQLISEQHLIEAIRVCRADLDLDLKDAKDTVEYLRAKASRGARAP